MNTLAKIIVETIDTLDNTRIEQLKSSIIKSYERKMKFPKNFQNKVMQMHGILNEMSNCAKRYNQLHKAGLADNAEEEVGRLFILIDEFYKISPKRVKANVDANFAIQELEKFIRNHIGKAGLQRAMKDFQTGMNLLNKGRKETTVASKQQLKEDGDFGNKTLACFCDACKNYSPRVIKKHIRRGAVANAVFETKNNPRINTDKLVCEICECLKA